MIVLLSTSENIILIKGFFLIFSDSDLQRPVEISLNKIRPYLLEDGGDFNLIKIENGCVYLRLEGACKKCPSSHATLKNKIERQLKIDIHPEIKVIKVD